MSDETKQEVMVPEKFKSLVEQVEQMSVIDLAELVKVLEEKFGVSASAPAMMMAAPGAAAEAVEEKTAFDVELVDGGSSKINTIKAVREITGLGLKEAKDLVDAAPKEVMTAVNKKTAEEAKEKLTAAGATVELK